MISREAITIYVPLCWLGAGNYDFGEGFFIFECFVEIFCDI